MASVILNSIAGSVIIRMGARPNALFRLNAAAGRSAKFSTSSDNNNNNGSATNSNVTTNKEKFDQTKQIKKSVFISQSYDVFTNLALEDWIYKNFDFSNHHVLLLWANDPCVVIGRHQNPFMESNVSNLLQNGITLARRNSGGGAVYHDRGNLNCTFFTSRDHYDRKYNLNILTRALFREWGIKTEISNRDDILLLGKKISGTAAKLGHPNAYHHCTLLVNSNKLHLSGSLVKDEAEIVCKATRSVKSSVKNIADVNRHVNIPQLLSAIGYEFLRTSAIELNDGGRELLSKQRGFQLLNPTDKWFPGITAIRDTFASWDWRFGKTPKFTVQKNVLLKIDNKEHVFKLMIDVVEGLIDNIVIAMPNSESIPVISTLKGREYTEYSLNGIISALKAASAENVKLCMNSSL